MARPLRIEYDGALYHVTSRGNERKPIFRDDTDRKLFLKILSQVTERFNWLCHAYCLMNNHYHLVIETLDGNLSNGVGFGPHPVTHQDQGIGKNSKKRFLPAPGKSAYPRKTVGTTPCPRF
jgi:hypothetical protein